MTNIRPADKSVYVAPSVNGSLIPKPPVVATPDNLVSNNFNNSQACDFLYRVLMPLPNIDSNAGIVGTVATVSGLRSVYSAGAAVVDGGSNPDARNSEIVGDTLGAFNPMGKAIAVVALGGAYGLRAFPGITADPKGTTNELGGKVYPGNQPVQSDSANGKALPPKPDEKGSVVPKPAPEPKSKSALFDSADQGAMAPKPTEKIVLVKPVAYENSTIAPGGSKYLEKATSSDDYRRDDRRVGAK